MLKTSTLLKICWKEKGHGWSSVLSSNFFDSMVSGQRQRKEYLSNVTQQLPKKFLPINQRCWMAKEISRSITEGDAPQNPSRVQP